MTTSVEPIRPFAGQATLLDAFRPPSGKVGTVGMITAMTADDETLEAIVETYTNSARPVRAARGDRALYLLLDGSAQEATTRARAVGVVPGLIELVRRAERPSGLLHAKVALLGFGPSRHAGPDTIRVVVATSNWTRASLSRQHELVWTIDVPVGRAGAAWPQERRDAIEVARLMQRLLQGDVVQLAEEHVPVAQRLCTPLHTLLAIVTSFPHSDVQPRIVHTLDERLWPQIKERLGRLAPPSANLLLCGSGSWDRPGDGQAQPEMLRTFESLRGSILGKKAELVAVVEPSSAVAVVEWLRGLDEDDARPEWTVVAPADRGRVLHAKYILIGRQANGRCSTGALYIGSANMTPQAMLQQAGPAGNVECGVVIATSCTGMRNAEGDPLGLEELLFEGDLVIPSENVTTVEESVELADALPPLCPIAYGVWDREHRTLTLVRQHETSSPPTTALILHVAGLALPLGSGATSVVLTGEVPEPTDLDVETEGGQERWCVPLLHTDGRLVAPPASPLSIDDALDALLAFPDDSVMAADDEVDDVEPTTASVTLTRRTEGKRSREYPMLALAEFIERVARRQVSLTEDQVEAWLDHMDLVLATVCAVPWSVVLDGTDAFPGPLLEPGFAPPILNGTRERYERILMGHAKRWSTRA